MTKEKLIQALNEAFAWKYNSLAAYILAAEPYVRPEEAEILESVRSIAATDQSERDRIHALIDRLEGVSRMDTYPPFVGELNFLSINYLRKVLKEQIEAQKAVYDAHALEFAADADARALFSDLAKHAEANLARL